MSEARRMRGLAARRSGRRAEVVAALWLIARGYRILGFRLQTPQGEIDLLVSRGPALAAVGLVQRQRLRRALAAIAARRGASDARIRLDLLALAPGRFPRHIPGAWSEDADLS